MKRFTILFIALMFCSGFMYAQNSKTTKTAESTDTAKNDYKSAVFITIGDLTKTTISGYKGTINYGYQLSDLNLIRAGISGAFQVEQQIAANTSDSLLILGLNGAYLFYFHKDTVKPYVGVGLELNYNNVTNPLTSANNLTLALTGPLGLECTLLKWLKIGVEGSLNLSYSSSGANAEPADTGILTLNLTNPVFVVSTWF